MKKVNEEIYKIKEATKNAGNTLGAYKQTAFHKFPLLFVLLSSFGLVATFYGFEKVIDSVPILQNNPIWILAVGLLALWITGSLYKKLS